MHAVILLARYCWIGCCAVALVQQTRLLFGHSVQFGWVEGAVFCGSVVAYNVMRREVLAHRLVWIAGVCAFAFWVNMPTPARWTALAAAGIWVLYYGAHLPVRTGLRSVPLLKPLAIAGAWGMVTVLLPLPMEAWSKAGALLVGRMAFIVALALAYDLCDSEDDRQFGFQTFATLFGPQLTLRVIDISLIISAHCVVINVALGYYNLPAGIALLTSLAVCALAVRKIIDEVSALSTQKMIIDGLMVVQFALVFLENSVLSHPTLA